MTDTVDKVIIESQVQGADQTAAGLKKVEDGLTGVTVASDSTEKSTASVERRFQSLERQMGTTSGQQQKLEKIQRDVNLAVAQNPALQERANDLLARAADRYDATTAAITRQAAELERINSVQKTVNSVTGVTGGSDAAARGADVAAYGKQLDDLRAKYNPLFAAGQNYKTTLTEINQAAKVGALTEAERVAAISRTKDAFAQQVVTLRSVKGATDESIASTGKFTGSTKLARDELINLSRQAQDVVVSLGSGQSFGTVLLQQGAQIGDVFASTRGTVAGFFGQVASGAGTAINAVAAFITPARLAAGAVIAIGVEAVYAAASWAESEKQIERALAGIGKASGANAEDVTRAAATSANSTNTSFAAAQAGATELLKTGTVYKDTFSELTLVTSKFALATGTTTVEAAQKLSAAFEGDESAIMALNKQYGFLNATTLNQIRTYNQLGDAQNAQLTFLKAFEPVLDKLEDKGGAWSRTFNRIVNTASNINSALGATLSGGSSDQERVANLKSQRSQIASQNATPEVGSRGTLALPNPELLAGINKQIAELEARIKAADDAAHAAQIDKLGLQVDAITRSAIPAIGQLEQLSQAYFKLQQAKDAGISSPENDAASRAIQVQSAMLVESSDQADRYNKRVSEIAVSYKDLGTSAALAHQASVNQLPVIEAIGGAAKMAAQYAADYANALDKGKTPADALVLAQDNLAKSQAASKNSIDQQIQSLKDSTDLIKAQQKGTEATTAAAIAYRNAYRETGDAAKASELATATMANSLARAKSSTAGLAQDLKAAAQAAQASANAWEQTYTLTSGRGTSASQSGAGGSGDAAAFGFKSSEGYKSTSNAGIAILQSYQATQSNTKNLVDLADATITAGKGIAAAISEAQAAQPQAQELAKTFPNVPFSYYGLQDKIAKPAISESEIMGTVGTLFDLKNAQTTDNAVKVSNLNEELAWLNSRPETIARDQRIVSLMASIDQLKKATDSNTAAVQATLNPLYSQGHGALAIGYYKAATGLEGIVGGSGGVDSTPIRVMATPGEHFKFTPPGQSSNDNARAAPAQIVNNNNFIFNDASTNNARRSRRQFAQGFGQTAHAMSR